MFASWLLGAAMASDFFLFKSGHEWSCGEIGLFASGSELFKLWLLSDCTAARLPSSFEMDSISEWMKSSILKNMNFQEKKSYSRESKTMWLSMWVLTWNLNQWRLVFMFLLLLWLDISRKSSHFNLWHPWTKLQYLVKRNSILLGLIHRSSRNVTKTHKLPKLSKIKTLSSNMSKDRNTLTGLHQQTFIYSKIGLKK